MNIKKLIIERLDEMEDERKLGWISVIVGIIIFLSLILFFFGIQVGFVINMFIAAILFTIGGIALLNS